MSRLVYMKLTVLFLICCLLVAGGFFSTSWLSVNFIALRMHVGIPVEPRRGALSIQRRSTGSDFRPVAFRLADPSRSLIFRPLYNISPLFMLSVTRQLHTTSSIVSSTVVLEWITTISG